MYQHGTVLHLKKRSHHPRAPSFTASRCNALCMRPFADAHISKRESALRTRPAGARARGTQRGRAGGGRAGLLRGEVGMERAAGDAVAAGSP